MESPWPEAPVRPRKGLGQHFLVNRGVLRQILDAAEVTMDDIVIEVGPGTGVLTRELSNRAGVLIAIELDRDLAARLRAELGDRPGVHILQGDILHWPPAALLTESTGARLEGGPRRGQGQSYKVVANLPYYITAPVLRHFLAGEPAPSRMVAMVQYEVARSLVAGPGEMSLLAVAVQFYGKPEIVASVSPGSFRPPPKVRSAILRIDTYTRPPVNVSNHRLFFDTVRAGFSSRRKQLHNALAQGLAISAAKAALFLHQADIDPQRRAQTLTLEEWARLTRVRKALLDAGRPTTC